MSQAFLRQTEELISCWSRPGLEIDNFVEFDVDHFDLVDWLASADSEFFQRFIGWLS